MRWTLLLLLVANAAIGGFIYWQTTHPVTANEATLAARFNNLTISDAQQNRIDQSASRSPALTEVSARECIRIGGLSQQDGIPVVTARLRALEIEPSAETVETVLRTDYQVTFGPFPSEELARRQLQALSTRDIDSYIITSGLYKNALSLGVFSSETNAQRKIDQLSSLNIDATLVLKEQRGDAVQLIIKQDSAALISDETLKSILAPYTYADFVRYNCA